MAGFRLTKQYTMPKEEVREAAEGLAANLERNHKVRSRWEGDTVRITGAGIDGQLSFHDGLIDISVKLGFLTSMFESVLRKEMKRYLDTHVS
jgi:putative polyhydroxyalkanoate system protein